jgi:hypothetical protein
MRTLLPPLFALSLTACDPATGGRAVEVTFAVGGTADDPSSAEPTRSFETYSGWDVTLDEAWIAVGPFIAWENPPPLASGALSVTPASLWSLFVR